MYGSEDVKLAKRRVSIGVLRLMLVLLPLLAAYVLGIIRDMPEMMLAVLLTGFMWCVFAADFWLLPALRYAKFLREMENGLRRSAECILLELEKRVQIQDGVCVRALHVQLDDGGDSRIYYVNVSKADMLPEMGRAVKLVSFGRHVVECVVE